MPVTLSLSAARTLVAAALEANRTSPGNAASVAEALVAAQACGLAGHGLSRVPSYAAQSRSGKVDGFAQPTDQKSKPGILSIDAAFGFAYPALDLAIARLPGMAREQGVAVAAIKRSHHCGAAGLIVERMADAGVAALLFANTPRAIAPWGGRRGLFGTNPLAFAAPLAGRSALVIDLSLSKVARGNILAARQKQERIPEGWALDAQGQPTTDPEAALQGTMVPMGDAKGTALALMVELLAAGLTGSRFAFEATSFLDAAGDPPGTGQLIVAFSPSAIGGPGTASHLLGLVSAVETEPGARLPGARRLASRAEAERAGLSLPGQFVKELEGLAATADEA